MPRDPGPGGVRVGPVQAGRAGTRIQIDPLDAAMNLAGPGRVFLVEDVGEDLPEEGVMTTSRTETVPATWDDARDVPFFRITQALFSPRFCLGASVLLAGNDDDPARPTDRVAVSARPA